MMIYNIFNLVFADKSIQHIAHYYTKQSKEKREIQYVQISF